MCAGSSRYQVMGIVYTIPRYNTGVLAQAFNRIKTFVGLTHGQTSNNPTWVELSLAN